MTRHAATEGVSPLEIRSARWSDWPQLGGVVREIFPHITQDEASYLLRRHHAATVVACRGSLIVGYYQFYAHAEPGSAWLNHFGVTPEARGSGTADALLSRFLQHAKTCGFASAALDTFDDNARAQRFYERAGFERVSRQAQEDGVKWRFRRSLSGIDALCHTVPAIGPPGRWTRAWRKLVYQVLTALA
jgi:ribosomal protein S18 acetylase RimI-like enzyme